MAPYIVVYFLVIMSAFCIGLKNRFSSILNPVLFFLIIVAFSSLFYLRDLSIGIDTYTYSEIFTDVMNLSDISEIFPYSYLNNLEIGFIFIVYLLGKIGGIQFIFTFLSVILYFNYVLVLNKLKINPLIYFMSFFSYFGVYLWSFNILRQMIAVSIIALGTMYLLDNKNKHFFFLVLLASLIHYSAFVCIIFYFVKKYLDFFYKLRYFLIFLTILLSKIGLVLISSYYSRYDDYATVSNMESIGFMLLSFYFITFLLSDFFYKNIKEYSYHFKFFIVIFSFYLALQTSFLINDISNYGTTRIVIYFLWPCVIIWAIFLKNIKDLNVRLILNILFASFMFLYWFWVLINSKSDILPFKFSIF